MNKNIEHLSEMAGYAESAVVSAHRFMTFAGEERQAAQVRLARAKKSLKRERREWRKAVLELVRAKRPLYIARGEIAATSEAGRLYHAALIAAEQVETSVTHRHPAETTVKLLDATHTLYGAAVQADENARGGKPGKGRGR